MRKTSAAYGQIDFLNIPLQALRQIAKCGNKLKVIGQVAAPHEYEQTSFLNWIWYEIEFKHWYFCHWYIGKVLVGKIGPTAIMMVAHH